MVKYQLVTGGCGYIGSHLTNLLSLKGFNPLVIDDLSFGYKQALLCKEPLIVGDIGDPRILEKVFTSYNIDAVFHLAARIKVLESVEKPLSYYENNLSKTITLLNFCKKYGVKKFIFSSTAAVYGDHGKKDAICEMQTTHPINPYGKSKLMAEWVIQDFARSSQLRYSILRYFNVAGAHPALTLGQVAKDPTHLITVACKKVQTREALLSIYGVDYPTFDGTCIRDYIHVQDLADIHLSAYEYLQTEQKSFLANCGYGKGYSVKEVIRVLEDVIGRRVKTKEDSPRSGDAPCLVANCEKIKGLLSWRPQYDSLQEIVGSSFSWEKKQQKSPWV